MPIDVENKVALITGAASGLGFVYASELLRNGLRNVTVVDVNEDVGKQSVNALCQEYGSGKAIFVKADVNSDQDLEDALKETVSRFKNIDIVINNAAIIDEPNWSNVIDTNLKGVIRGTLLGIDYINKHNSGGTGQVVNIASIAALTVVPGFPFYSSVKTAVLMFSRTLGHLEHYQRTNVEVICICPGLTNTNMTKQLLQKTYNAEFLEILQKFVAAGNFPMQEVNNIGKSFVKVLKTATTGSVWVIENEEDPFELEFPDRYGVKKQ